MTFNLDALIFKKKYLDLNGLIPDRCFLDNVLIEEICNFVNKKNILLHGGSPGTHSQRYGILIKTYTIHVLY